MCRVTDAVTVVAWPSSFLRWTLTSRVLALTGSLVASNWSPRLQVGSPVDHRGGEAVHSSVPAHRRDRAGPRVPLVAGVPLLLFRTLWTPSTWLRRWLDASAAFNVLFASPHQPVLLRLPHHEADRPAQRPVLALCFPAWVAAVLRRLQQSEVFTLKASLLGDWHLVTIVWVSTTATLSRGGVLGSRAGRLDQGASVPLLRHAVVLDAAVVVEVVLAVKRPPVDAWQGLAASLDTPVHMYTLPSQQRLAVRRADARLVALIYVWLSLLLLLRPAPADSARRQRTQVVHPGFRSWRPWPCRRGGGVGAASRVTTSLRSRGRRWRRLTRSGREDRGASTRLALLGELGQPAGSQSLCEVVLQAASRLQVVVRRAGGRRLRLRVLLQGLQLGQRDYVTAWEWGRLSFASVSQFGVDQIVFAFTLGSMPNSLLTSSIVVVEPEAWTVATHHWSSERKS